MFVLFFAYILYICISYAYTMQMFGITCKTYHKYQACICNFCLITWLQLNKFVKMPTIFSLLVKYRYSIFFHYAFKNIWKYQKALIIHSFQVLKWINASDSFLCTALFFLKKGRKNKVRREWSKDEEKNERKTRKK